MTRRPAAWLALLLLASSVDAATESLTAQQTTDITAEAQARVNDAIPILGKIKGDPQVNELLQKAKGVVIVPHYLQAALVFGAQIGGTKGALVFLLMSDKAVDAFANNPSTWSMSAGAGLTAVNYSKKTPDAGTLSDVVVWSDVKGLFGGAAVGASKITRDTTANEVYYKKPDVTAQQILGGTVTSPEAKLLVDALPVQAPVKR